MRTFLGGLELEFFHPLEFDHPELMDPEFLVDLDDLRRRCGFPVRITDDARTDVDMTRLYGPDTDNWPDSAHLYRSNWAGEVEYRPRVVDCKPAGNLGFVERERREMEIVFHALDFFRSGRWPNLGLEIATAHIHIDDYNNRQGARRPTIFPGVSI